DDRPMGHRYWPLYDLVVRTPRLELRYLDDALRVGLAPLAAGGVHAPGWMPFAIPWTDAASPELERNSLRYWWGLRADTTPEHWELALGVVVDGCPVGITSITAESFPRPR